MQLITKCPQCGHGSSLQGNPKAGFTCMVCNFKRPFTAAELEPNLRRKKKETEVAFRT